MTTLNEEAKDHSPYDNPRDPFASPDRIPPPEIPSNSQEMREALEERLCRVVRKARDFDPDTLYQHLGEDYPTDSADSEGRTFYKSWRKELPSVRAVLAALFAQTGEPEREALEALKAWHKFQSMQNTTTLYNTASRLVGATFNPAEYDNVE